MDANVMGILKVIALNMWISLGSIAMSEKHLTKFIVHSWYKIIIKVGIDGTYLNV